MWNKLPLACDVKFLFAKFPKSLESKDYDGFLYPN